MKQWNPEHIKQLRNKLRLSQRAFGELIGVTERYVIYLEKGVRNPSKTLMHLLNCIEREKRKRERKGE